MSLLIWICVIAIVVALAGYLWVAVRFWANFQLKVCPNCGSRKSHFLGYTHMEKTSVDLNAFRCKKCLTEFVIIDGTVHVREAGGFN